MVCAYEGLNWESMLQVMIPLLTSLPSFLPPAATAAVRVLRQVQHQQFKLEPRRLHTAWEEERGSR